MLGLVNLESVGPTFGNLYTTHQFGPVEVISSFGAPYQHLHNSPTHVMFVFRVPKL